MDDLTALSVIAAAVALDWVLGEPKQFHPLIWFGSVADRIEAVSERPVFERIPPVSRGFCCWLILVLPPALAVWLLLVRLPPAGQLVLECLVLYFSIGWKSMQEHASEVHQQLMEKNLDKARMSVSKIVSRKTDELDERGVAKGAIEAVIENGSDCVLSPIFWYLLLGAPGALMFRLANTLDAMWGNKTDRYIHFGRPSAKFDDFLNWVPARLTAISYAICGNFGSAWWCMRNQKAVSEGPNAGLVMAAGGGALNIKLGGPAIYHGKLDVRPILGIGREVESQDIVRSIRLLRRTIALWILFLAIVCALWLWADFNFIN